MEYSKSKEYAIFSGNVKLSAGDILLNCEKAITNIAKKDIHLENVFFTTCQAEDPHYHYFAKNVNLILEKEITAKNVVFYLDDVPLGAIPYYYKSLRQSKLKIDFKHGYNKNDNYFTNGFIGYRFSEAFYSKIYLDYYSYKGFGCGLEEIYNLDDKIHGSVYGYHIQERNTGKKRWNARIYHLQSFKDNWFAQINSNFASDESFNDSYSRDWIKVYRDITSSVALTKNTTVSTTRVLFSRHDVFDLTTNKYILDRLLIPSVAYSTNKIKIKKLPLYYEFSANGERTWNSSENFCRTNANGSIKLSNPFRITRKITLTSAVGAKTYWQDCGISNYDKNDVYRWTYNADINFNVRLCSFLNNQFGYYFEHEPDKKNDPYNGVVISKLKTIQSIYLDNLAVRIWAGLDVRCSSSPTHGYDIREKFDSIISEIDYDPYKFLNLYYKNDYNIFYKKPNSVQISSELRFGTDRFNKGKETAYIKNGISYNRSIPSNLTFIGEVGLRPTKCWQLAYKMQSSFDYDFTNNRYYERSINIHRDLHCWEALFSYLDRMPLRTGEKNFYEFWFNLKIKSNLTSSTDIAESERKWYPWR